MFNNILNKIKQNTDWKLVSVLILAFVIRVIDLNYNGPYIDESFHTAVLKFGNVFYITGEAYLWPVISYFVYKIGGIIAVRFVAGVFGTLTVGFVYKIAEIFSRKFNKDNNYVGFLAALVFSLSAPALFVSTLGGYDAMAFMLYALGFWQLAKGIEKNKSLPLFWGAVFLTLSAATRYMVFIYLPVAIIYAIYSRNSDNKKKILYYFLFPLATLFTVYWLLNKDHIISSIWLALNLEIELLASQSIIYVFKNLFISVWPIILLSVAGSLIYIVKAIKNKSREQIINILFLAGATSLIFIYHIYSGNDLAMNRNLTMAVMFGSIISGLVLNSLISYRGKIKYIIIVILAVILFWQAKTVVAKYRDWPDWRPVVKAVRDLGLSDKIIWCTAYHGGLGNVWQLRAEFGSGVDIDSPWYAPESFPYSPDSEGVLKVASKKKIPIVVGPLEGWKLEVGSSVDGYKIKKVIKLNNDMPTVYIFEIEKSS